jgi:hypothetical protein
VNAERGRPAEDGPTEVAATAKQPDDALMVEPAGDASEHVRVRGGRTFLLSAEQVARLSRPGTKAGRMQRACLVILFEHRDEGDDGLPTSGRFIFYEIVGLLRDRLAELIPEPLADVLAREDEQRREILGGDDDGDDDDGDGES